MNNLDWILFGHIPRMYDNIINEEYEVQRLLRETLNTPSPYKYVVDSSNINNVVKHNIYDSKQKNHSEQTSCCISLEDFKDNEEIIELPCSHIFKPESIENWLKNEKAECPVCRFKLPCIEIKNTDENEIFENTEQNSENTEQNSENNINYNPLIQDENLRSVFNTLRSLENIGRFR
jgi:hypothetical protein